MSKFFAANLKALAVRNSRLAAHIEKLPPDEDILVRRSKSGLPVPVIKDISFHSSYYPEKEREQLAPQIDATHQVVMFGFGFCYHLEQLASQAGSLTVIEPECGMIRAAMHVVRGDNKSRNATCRKIKRVRKTVAGMFFASVSATEHQKCAVAPNY